MGREAHPPAHGVRRGHPSPAGLPVYVGCPQCRDRLSQARSYSGARGPGGDRRGGRGRKRIPGGRDRGRAAGHAGLADRALPAGGTPALRRTHHRPKALQFRGRPPGRVCPHPGSRRQRRPHPPGRFAGRGRHGGGHAEHGPLRRGAGGGPAGGHRRGHGRWSCGPHGHCRGQGPGGSSPSAAGRPASSWPGSMGPRTL